MDYSQFHFKIKTIGKCHVFYFIQIGNFTIGEVKSAFNIEKIFLAIQM